MLGFIIRKDCILTREDAERLKKEFGCDLILISIYDEDYFYLKSLSRTLDIPYKKIEGFAEFSAFSRRLEYCVSEWALGAIYSLLSYTPCYIDIKFDENIELYRLASQISKSRVLFPYNEHKDRIKKVGVSHSDFDKAFADLLRIKL